METLGATDAFTGAMQALGCECASYGSGRLKLVMPDRLEIRDLYQVAAAQGVQVRRLNHRRDSLEDIFLNAMEGKMTGAAHGSL
jgi:ABC-2 type transport system ATP-binding protein